MLQLVGQKCAICHERIESITEGLFCVQCASPVHLKCRKTDVAQLHVCPDCGAEFERAAEQEQARRKEGVALQKDVKSYHLTTGLGRIVAGVLCLVVVVALLPCMLSWWSWIFLMVVIGTVFATGVSLIAAGLAQLRAARRGEFSRDSQELVDGP